MNTLPINGILYIPSGTDCIEQEAYAGRDDIREVHIPLSVTKIGAGAFAECEALCRLLFEEEAEDAAQKETLPLTIGEGAFLNCSALSEVRFPKRLRRIEEMGFWGSGLRKAILPEGLREIGPSAFWDCSALCEIEVPSVSTRFYKDSFGCCEKLTHGFIAGIYPAETDPPAELLYAILWASSFSQHDKGSAGSKRAADYLLANPMIVMERILKTGNVAAMNGIRDSQLYAELDLSDYAAQALDLGYRELSALLVDMGKKRTEDFDVLSEYEL